MVLIQFVIFLWLLLFLPIAAHAQHYEILQGGDFRIGLTKTALEKMAKQVRDHFSSTGTLLSLSVPIHDNYTSSWAYHRESSPSQPSDDWELVDEEDEGFVGFHHPGKNAEAFRSLTQKELSTEVESQKAVTLAVQAGNICTSSYCGASLCKGLVSFHPTGVTQTIEYVGKDKKIHADPGDIIIDRLTCTDELKAYSFGYQHAGQRKIANHVLDEHAVTAISELNQINTVTRNCGPNQITSSPRTGEKTPLQRGFSLTSVVNAVVAGAYAGAEVARKTPFKDYGLGTAVDVVAAVGQTTVGRIVAESQSSPSLKGKNVNQLIQEAESFIDQWKPFLAHEQEQVLRRFIKDSKDALKNGLKELIQGHVPSSGVSGQSQVSWNSLEETGLRDIEANNPTMETLKRILERGRGDRKKLSDLVKWLEAIDAIIKLPLGVQSASHKAAEKNKRNASLRGSRTFIESLHTISGVLTNEIEKGAIPEKRVYAVVSSPGTGKSTNIEKSAKEIYKIPSCKISGKQVNAAYMAEGDHQTRKKVLSLESKGNSNDDSEIQKPNAYLIIIKLINQCLKEFQVDGRYAQNGYIIFDDFHDALDPPGVLSTDSKSRNLFFGLLTQLGDKTYGTIQGLEGEIVTGIHFPYNVSRVTPFITLNTLPDELDASSQLKDGGALISRLELVPHPPLTLQDRIDSAMADLKLIEGMMPNGDHELQSTFHWEICQENLQKIAKADIALAELNPQLGIRGLSGVLSKYQTHISKKWSANPKDKNACSFDAPEGGMRFEISKAMDGIQDYEKPTNSNLDEMAFARELRIHQKRIESDLESKVGTTLTQNEVERIRQLLSKAMRSETGTGAKEQKSSLSERKKALGQAYSLLEVIQQRKNLPGDREIEKKIKEEFQGLGVSLSDLGSVVAGMQRRMEAARNDAKVSPPNRIIRVYYDDPADHYLNFYHELGELFGIESVCHVTEFDELFRTKKNPCTLSEDQYNKIKAVEQGKFQFTTFRIKDGSRDLAEYKTLTCIKNDSDDRQTYCYTRSADKNSLYVLNKDSINDYTTMVDGRTSESFFVKIELRQGEEPYEAMTRQFAPKFNLWNHCYRQFQRSQKFGGDGIIVIQPNAQMKQKLAEIKGVIDPDSKDSPFSWYQQHILKYLKGNVIEVTDPDAILDPKKLTVFFASIESESLPLDPKSFVSLRFGSVSIESRRAIARATVLKELKNVAEWLNSEGARFNLQDLKLNDEEEKVFEELIVLDLETARFMEQYRRKAPLDPLLDEVRALVAGVKVRLDNPYHLPTEEDYKRRLSSLKEKYQKLTDPIKKELENLAKVIEEGTQRAMKHEAKRAKSKEVSSAGENDE